MDRPRPTAEAGTARSTTTWRLLTLAEERESRGARTGRRGGEEQAHRVELRLGHRGRSTADHREVVLPPTSSSRGTSVFIRAVEKFDYKLGYKLSTYAGMQGIKQDLCGALADNRDIAAG